ncbi:hypothetical protein [Pseudomonas sp. MWU12-2037]|nr:hypothetical protein [Pseudomonas sp. MWU12-2037]
MSTYIVFVSAKADVFTELFQIGSIPISGTTSLTSENGENSPITGASLCP